MREGFTTGSCAAAAALASCLWQLEGECPNEVSITVPAGRVFRAAIVPGEGFCCGVVKDAGDDPDITHGSEVRARVDIGEKEGGIAFRAGPGVGVITLPGLKLPAGEAAINPVPRAMIEDAVRSAIGGRAATVTVSIQRGEALAQKTFNPRLGIVGGLSVLGTTGIVRPMSEEALKDCIALEIAQKRAQGAEHLAFVFGAQGENIMAARTQRPIVQTSNFVGFALDEAVRHGVRSVLIGGHPGKMAKVAAGAMQTHSACSDGRREAVITALALLGADAGVVQRVWDSRTTDEMVDILAEARLAHAWDRVARQAKMYCLMHVRHRLSVEAMLWDGRGGLLAATGKDEA